MMNQNKNIKEIIIDFLKVAALSICAFIPCLAAAATFHAVTLGAISSFYGWMAGLNLLLAEFGTISLRNIFYPQKDKKE